MDQQLHVFVMVAERKNFSRAAESLHMTQPAVSQYIRILEEHFGVRLLERTNKYVHLTKAGDIVYHHAKDITRLYHRMAHLVDDLTNHPNGPLSIGASYTFGEYVLPHIIANMKQNYPDITPTVTIGNTAEIADGVMQYDLDIGIVEGHFKEEKQLHTTAFAEDEMVIVASANHHFASQTQPVVMQDLNEETWVLREKGSGTREAADNLFQRYGLSPAAITHFGSTQAIKVAIESGMGISLLSKWVIQKELKKGDMVIIDVDGLPVTREFSMVTASTYQTKALQVFIDMLMHHNELNTFKQQKKT